MAAQWEPFREEASATLKRNIGITLVAGPLVSQVLGYTGPISGEELLFEAPLPPEMAQLLRTPLPSGSVL